MTESFLQNKVFQLVMRLIIALSFTLFTAYQGYLAFTVESNRFGRLLGIAIYLVITAASILAIFDNDKCWTAHSVLLVVGLLLLFAVRLTNLPVYFGELDLSSAPSVLNCAVFIISELGTLVLALGYLMLRVDLEQKQMRILIIILMSVVILLYLAGFVLECVMMFKYNMNVEAGKKLSLLSRLLYLVGFVGTAFCFMLPAPEREETQQEGQFLYSENDEEEVDLVI